MVLLSRGKGLRPLAAFTPTVAVVFWARASNIGDLSQTGPLLAVILLAGALLVLRRRNFHRVFGAAMIGIFAGSTWQPCVGFELGKILNGAPEDQFAHLGPVLAFTAGLTLLLVAFAMLPRVSPKIGAILSGRVAVGIGFAGITVIVVAVLLDRYNTILGELARISFA